MCNLSPYPRESQIWGGCGRAEALPAENSAQPPARLDVECVMAAEIGQERAEVWGEDAKAVGSE